MKTNPKRIPRTQADVRKAFIDGVNCGVYNASAIFLTVLLDHHGFNSETIRKVWEDITKLSEEVGDGMVSVADLKHVLLTEYGIKV